MGDVRASSDDLPDATGVEFDYFGPLDVDGVFSTEHAAASYGLPVFVYRGQCYGPADLANLGVGPLTVSWRTDAYDLAAIAAAGYTVRLLNTTTWRARVLYPSYAGPETDA